MGTDDDGQAQADSEPADDTLAATAAENVPLVSVPTVAVNDALSSYFGPLDWGSDD